MHPFTALHVPKGHVGLHWFEQNAYALEDSTGTVLMIDPYFPHERPADRFVHSEPPLVEAELPTQVVLLTHRHGDHMHPETISRIRAAWPDAVYVGPEEAIAQVLAETEVDASHTFVVRAGESCVQGPFLIQAFHSKPPEGDPAAGIAAPDVTHLGYVIGVEGLSIYVTGDAINTLSDQGDLLAPIAALSPNIGLVTTHPTEGEFPFFEGAKSLAIKLGLEHIVPSHYSCFVKRDYDPEAFAAMFGPGDPEPIIIPWNSHIVYP